MSPERQGSVWQKSYEAAKNISRQVAELLDEARRRSVRLEWSLIPRGFSEDDELEGRAADEYLSTLRESLVARAARWARHLDQADWLWLLRSLDPHDIWPHFPTLRSGSGLQHLRTAENLSAYASSGDSRLTTGQEQPSSRDLEVCATLVSMSVQIAHLESFRRRTHKGQVLRVRVSRSPSIVPNSPVESAIRNYDTRLVGYVEEWHPKLSETPKSSQVPLLAAFRYPTGWWPTESWVGAPGRATVTEEVGQFTIRRWMMGHQGYLDRVPDMVAATANPALASATVVMSAGLYLWLYRTKADCPVDLLHRGLLHVPSADLLRVLRDVRAEAETQGAYEFLGRHLPDKEEAILALLGEAHAPGLPGASGPVVRSLDSRSSLVDVSALTALLSSTLTLDGATASPSIVHEVSFGFEHLIQEAIDESDLAPDSVTRSLRGRELKFKGNPVTDIDALLVSNGQLLLVSCKRVTLGPDYDLGTHNRVRNAADRVAHAVDEWEDIIDFLRLHPVGDNYDLSQFIEIDGVVVTPELVFTAEDRCLEQVSIKGKGTLHRVSTAGELVSLIHDRKRVYCEPTVLERAAGLKWQQEVAGLPDD